MKIYASTIPQSRFVTAVPAKHKGRFLDSAWAMVGTVNRILAPEMGYGYQPWGDDAKARWEKTADVAVELKFPLLVIDCEMFGPRLPAHLTDPAAAKLAIDYVGLVAKWVRQRQPKLGLTFYGCCPAWAAMNINEETPEAVLAAYDALCFGEQVLAPSTVMFDNYWAGPGWLAELNRKAAQAQRFYPGAAKRVLLSPSDYSKPRVNGSDQYMGRARLRQLVRWAATVGEVELWTDPLPPMPDQPAVMPWAEQAWDDIADLAA